ncbi:hypothetical protein H6F43_15820 [Leptolyngbya sp. FACHB-36]|uniref:DUF6883 domain-containing protein n=1 Tax=Leptolyngbya sp. FACHB-36 TaxID=2692808 RepID=UPI001680C073|nr:DUF6883 domain-containing protein [Leptolyngbya sp. FACHB-36]MBD2021648.1 hypothetical protein [Leptolyngbya sp. FACHB-36]
MSWQSRDPLPNAQAVEIDLRKFEDYSMNPGNPGNQGKWVTFAAVGYDVQNPQNRIAAAQDVVTQLRQQLSKTPATQGQSNRYGPRFEVRVVIRGANGREGTLVTIWQLDRGTEIPRLITNWLEVHQ